MEPTDLIWINGDFIAWEDAKVHVLTHGLHYGTGVFEGVRCYDTRSSGWPCSVTASTSSACCARPSCAAHAGPILRGSAAPRHPWFIFELIAANGLRSCYIRPIINRGYGQMGLTLLDAPVDETCRW